MFVKGFVSLVIILSACTTAYEDKTIAQWLQDNGYTTLVSLLRTANLYDLLNNQASGPFTVFAPTDAAFAAIPPDTLKSLQSNPTILASVLKYHVVSGFNLAPLIHDGTIKDTLNGQSLLFKKLANGTIKVETASIVKTDQIVNNGVVHTIDSVLLPVTQTIGEVLLGRQDKYSIVNVLLQITDLEPQLMGKEVTLFAPTDEAFNRLQNILPDFSSASVIDQYREILKNHLVNGTYFSRNLVDGQVLTTLHGSTVTVHLNNGIKIGNTGVVEPDIKAVNGVIHGLDGVLVPQNVAL